MKRVLVIGALIFAIGGSIVSGTMAKYTQDLGEREATIKVKTFNVNSNLKGELTDIEIDPFSKENEEEFKFEVVNYDEIGGNKSPSEVDIIVDFTLEVIDKNKDKKKNELLKQLEVSVESDHFSIQKEKSDVEIKGKEGTIKGKADFKVGVSEKKTFEVEVRWDKQKIQELKKAVENDEVGLKLKVHATQK